MNLLEGAPPGTGIEERSCLSLPEEQAFADQGSSYSVITAVILTGLVVTKGRHFAPAKLIIRWENKTGADLTHEEREVRFHSQQSCSALRPDGPP